MTIAKNEFEFIHFETIDSTNNYAKTLCKLGLTNKVIIADTQTAGRTTKKQGWISPKGNLYFTILTKLDDEKKLPEYAFLSALAIDQSIEQIDTNKNSIKIKWPNDILLNKQKLCGILIEKEENSVIIGIGLNINSSPAPELTRYPTTALSKNKINILPTDLAKIILEKFINNINIRNNENFEKIISFITPYMYKFGEEIYISSQNQTLTGKFCGLDKTGALILDTGNETKKIISGELTKENFL